MPAKAPVTPNMMVVELLGPELLEDCLEDIPTPAVCAAALEEENNAEPAWNELENEDVTIGGVVTARGIEKGEKVVATKEVCFEVAGSGVEAGDVVEVWCDAKGVVTGTDAFTVVEVCETALVVVIACTEDKEVVESVAWVP